jgi:hypothetical protein
MSSLSARLASDVVTLVGQRARITALLEATSEKHHTTGRVIGGDGASAGDWDSIRHAYGAPWPDPELRVPPAPRLPQQPGQAVLARDAEIGGNL